MTSGAMEWRRDVTKRVVIGAQNSSFGVSNKKVGEPFCSRSS